MLVSNSYLTSLVWEQVLEALITLPDNSPKSESQPFHLVVEWPWKSYLGFISLTLPHDGWFLTKLCRLDGINPGKMSGTASLSLSSTNGSFPLLHWISSHWANLGWRLFIPPVLISSPFRTIFPVSTRKHRHPQIILHLNHYVQFLITSFQSSSSLP